jgi:hypothetical protein
MVEDKYSKNWRVSQKTNETYSYLADLTHDELKQKVLNNIENKSKDVIELGDYFYFPLFFKDNDGKDVQMVYRYLTKDKALERANKGSNSGGSGKQFAPRKEYARSFDEIIEVELHDYQQQADLRKSGKIALLAQDLGSRMITENEQGIKYLYYGKPFKVEL